MTDTPTIADQIKSTAIAIINKQLEVNAKQGELNTLQNTQQALYLQQQLESLNSN